MHECMNINFINTSTVDQKPKHIALAHLKSYQEDETLATTSSASLEAPSLGAGETGAVSGEHGASGSSGLSASRPKALDPCVNQKVEVTLDNAVVDPNQLSDDTLQSGVLQNVARVRSQATPAKNSNSHAYICFFKVKPKIMHIITAGVS